MQRESSQEAAVHKMSQRVLLPWQSVSQLLTLRHSKVHVDPPWQRGEQLLDPSQATRQSQPLSQVTMQLLWPGGQAWSQHSESPQPVQVVGQHRLDWAPVQL